jgi:serine/threonine protein kinase
VDPSPPRLLGRYALYDRIASGGMATVHLGRLLGPVGFSRTVAIKRLLPQFAEDPEFVSMFLDEARLAARIRHPNVVPTLDVVSTQGEIFLVMEYIQGDSLARLIRALHQRGESPPPAMMATLMVGVCNGLHAAHEAKTEHGEPLGLVHRDVSPHNILVGIDGVARVLDFGVAKAIGRVQTTRDGQLKGKIAYMAPEQIRGTVSRLTDIYAAAVVLWEALVGRRLYLGETEAELFAKVLEGRVDLPSRHAANIPPALEAAIMRGLETDATRRFQTAREMARAVADAVPLVDASVIGDWVESLARPTLDTRNDLIASIESNSMIHAPRLVPSRASSASHAGPSSSLAPLTHAEEDIAVLEAEDALPTQLSSGSFSARDGGVRPGPRAHRLPWTIAIGSGLAALVFAVLLIAGTFHRATQASSDTNVGAAPGAAGNPTPTPGSAPPAVDSATPAQAATPSTSAPPTSTPDEASPVPAPTVTRGSKGPAGHRVDAPIPAASTRRGTNCNPPYYFQGGVRVFKTECL